jgi:hypothetical protein
MDLSKEIPLLVCAVPRDGQMPLVVAFLLIFSDGLRTAVAQEVIKNQASKEPLWEI